MSKNKEMVWKETIFDVLRYIIGIPLTIIASIIFGFMVVGFVWLIPNFIAGVLDWIINGTFPFVEVIEWTIIWTRVSIVFGIMIGIIGVITLYD